MRFDLPAYARLRLAVIARRERAWRTDLDGPEPERPVTRGVLTVPVILGAALALIGLALWGWYWFH